ncbi:MAG: PAS domain S-box protein, partial [Deltaproteobacteria bacterium]|nr:PAS domain S-box protein [Deltaproteobacteria bacterium]
MRFGRVREFLQRLTIFQRMLGFAVVASMALILTSLSNIPQLKALTDLNRDFYQHQHLTTNIVKDLKYYVLDARRIQREIIQEKSPERRQQLKEIMSQYDTKIFAEIDALKKTFTGDKNLLKDAESLYKDLIAFRNVNLVIADQGEREEAWRRTLDENQDNPAPKLAEKLNQVSDFAEEKARSMYQLAEDAYLGGVGEAVLYCSVGLLVMIVVSIIFTRSITHPLRLVRNSIVGLSENRLDEEIPFQDVQNELGEIGRALEALRSLAWEQKREARIKAGVAEIARALQPCAAYDEFGRALTSGLAPIMGLVYGAFFVSDPRQTHLQRAGGYACDDAIHASRFAWGQGLIGQAARDRKQMLLSLSPNEQIGVTIGLGKVMVQAIIITPILLQDELLGVLELGARQDFTDEQKIFLENLLPVVAMNMEILTGNLETRQLLEKSREQAQALAASEQQLLARKDELEEINTRLGEQAHVLEKQAEALEAQKESLLAQREELEASKEILAQTEERSRLILSSVNDGILGLNSEGQTSFINRAGAALLGYAEEELPGRPMHALAHYAYPDGRDYPLEECHMFKTIQDGHPRTINDEVLWRRDGTSFPAEYATTPMRKNGDLIGAVIVFRDITERLQVEQALRQAKEQAEEATKAKSEFLANMS